MLGPVIWYCSRAVRVVEILKVVGPTLEMSVAVIELLRQSAEIVDFGNKRSVAYSFVGHNVPFDWRIVKC